LVDQPPWRNSGSLRGALALSGSPGTWSPPGGWAFSRQSRRRPRSPGCRPPGGQAGGGPWRGPSGRSARVGKRPASTTGQRPQVRSGSEPVPLPVGQGGKSPQPSTMLATASRRGDVQIALPRLERGLPRPWRLSCDAGRGHRMTNPSCCNAARARCAPESTPMSCSSAWPRTGSPPHRCATWFERRARSTRGGRGPGRSSRGAVFSVTGRTDRMSICSKPPCRAMARTGFSDWATSLPNGVWPRSHLALGLRIKTPSAPRGLLRSRRPRRVRWWRARGESCHLGSLSLTEFILRRFGQCERGGGQGRASEKIPRTAFPSPAFSSMAPTLRRRAVSRGGRVYPRIPTRC